MRNDSTPARDRPVKPLFESTPEPFVPNWWAASVGATFSDGSSVVNRAAERPSPTRPPFPPMLRKTSGGGVCFERLALTTEP